MQSPDARPPSNYHPVFALAFRIFFISASVFSLAAILVWALSLHGSLPDTFTNTSIWWHAHEMIFGFSIAIAIGFLLTAAQTWTGLPSVKGPGLKALFIVWLLPRLFLPFAGLADHWFVITLDILFIPLAAFFLARMVVGAKQWRNIIFVPVLALFTIANMIMHWGQMKGDLALALMGAKSGIFLMVLLMTVIGGRIIPFFTSRRIGEPQVAMIKWIDIPLILGTIVFVIIGWIYSGWESSAGYGLVCAVLAALHSIRWFRWQFWKTTNIPLLWSLHASYLMIPVGFTLLAINSIAPSITVSLGIHAITVGAIGLMTLAMMTRVSLGHTGRPLEIHRIIPIAYLAIVTACLLRVFGPVIGLPMTWAYDSSALAWIIGFGIFSAIYWPILTRPRIDGKPG